MRVGLFRQPVFFFARRLAHPMLNRLGINNNRLDIYNSLWNLNADLSRSAGFLPSIYINWQLRRLLLGRNNSFYNSISNYIHLDNNITKMVNRLVNSSYGEVIPFIRQINYMIISIIGNLGLIFIKSFLKTTLLGGLTSIFTLFTATIGILWTPSLAAIRDLLIFGLKMKSFFDYYLSFLPGNLSIPIPEWLQKKISFGFNRDYLTYIIPILGYQVLDWISFNWLFDLVNSFLPFDLNLLSFLFKPLKAFLFYSIWYYIKDLIDENTINKVKSLFYFTKDWFFYLKDKINKYSTFSSIKGNGTSDNVNQNIQQTFKAAQYNNKRYHHSKAYGSRFLIYLFREFNLFE